MLKQELKVKAQRLCKEHNTDLAGLIVLSLKAGRELQVTTNNNKEVKANV